MVTCTDNLAFNGVIKRRLVLLARASAVALAVTAIPVAVGDSGGLMRLSAAAQEAPADPTVTGDPALAGEEQVVSEDADENSDDGSDEDSDDSDNDTDDSSDSDSDDGSDDSSDSSDSDSDHDSSEGGDGGGEGGSGEDGGGDGGEGGGGDD